MAGALKPREKRSKTAENGRLSETLLKAQQKPVI